MISHNFISSISFSIIFFQSKILAFLTCNSSSFDIASHAFDLALYSKYFHRFISVIIATAASKYIVNQ
ncbi:hypothetical protein HOG21_03410 [bacterium]|nr:hypothetical protein [bacterium]